MAGRYFDEWQVGDSVALSINPTATETDNVLISTLTHNPQPLHLDYEAASKTEFGKPLVNSCFTFSLMIGVSVGDTTLGTLVANLGYDALKFPNPVFAGDTLRSETECIAVRVHSHTSSSCWLNARIAQVTRPAFGRDLLSRRATHSLSQWSVSPVKTGFGKTTFSYPRFATSVPRVVS